MKWIGLVETTSPVISFSFTISALPVLSAVDWRCCSTNSSPVPRSMCEWTSLVSSMISIQQLDENDRRNVDILVHVRLPGVKFPIADADVNQSGDKNGYKPAVGLVREDGRVGKG